jgi:hypothetical protein
MIGLLLQIILLVVVTVAVPLLIRYDVNHNPGYGGSNENPHS